MKTLPLLPPLLFRQKLLLAALAGSVSLRDVMLGVAFFLLLVVVSHRERPLRYLLLGAAFLLGFGLTFSARSEPPACPSWAAVPGKSVGVEGRVASVTGLPGGRVRVLMEGLRPWKSLPPMSGETENAVRQALERRVDMPRPGRKNYPGEVVKDETSPLPDLVAMTLDAATLSHTGRPVQGQTLRALLRLYPVSGSLNPGTGDIAVYWADRDVRHRARLDRKSGVPVFLEWQEGEGWLCRAALIREEWRAALVRALAGNLPEDAATPEYQTARQGALLFSQGKAMLVALLFGDRSFLDPETVDIFTRAGLVHSLALSGQHLSLAAMAGAAVIFLLSRVLHGLYLVRPRRVLVVSAGIPFALAYLFLGGAPFSLIRAAFMMLAAAFFLCLRRPSAPLDALFAAALLLFLCYPLVAFDLSAQLSVLAVAGILLVMPIDLVLLKRFPSRPEGRGKAPFSLPRRIVHACIRWAGTMLLISFAAQLAVMPILVSMFGVVSLNLWENLLWLPLLTFITLPCAALGLILLVVCGAQPVSSLLFSVAAFPADAVLDLLFFLGDAGQLSQVQFLRPSSLSGLGYGAVLVGLAIAAQAALCRKKAGSAVRRLLVAGLLLMPAGQLPVWVDNVLAWYEQRVTLTLLDVGQGQAVLLSYPGGRVLVDGGGSPSPFFDVGRSILAPVLTAGRMPYLDAVVVSHTDMDHARGLRWILEHFKVGCLYWSPYSASSATAEGEALRRIAQSRGIPEKVLTRGDVLRLHDDVCLEVIWPDMEVLPTLHRNGRATDNEASLALRLTRNGEGLALLCGDMTTPALRRLVETGQDLRAGVLVLPHHGAASSFQTAFYDAVNPDAALASSAAFHRFGFPSRKVREEMKSRSIPLYSTSQSGALRVSWTKNGDMEIRPAA